MVIEKVKCENLFTGEEEEVTLYFHLTEAELTMLNLSSNNRFASFKEDDPKNTVEENIKLFEKIIAKAIGRRDEFGNFIKNDQIRDSFLCSPAYSAFLSKLISGEIKIEDFILGCLPRSISRQMEIKDGKPVIKKTEQNQ